MSMAMPGDCANDDPEQGSADNGADGRVSDQIIGVDRHVGERQRLVQGCPARSDLRRLERVELGSLVDRVVAVEAADPRGNA